LSKFKNTLDDLPPVYFPNEIDIVRQLFIPVAQSSNKFDCLSGYFSSKVISELAEPLSILFKDPSAKGRFIISPNLGEDDKEALVDIYARKASMFDYLVGEDFVSPNTLVSSTLDVMKFLISTNRLDIRIVLMKEGMMHAKIWIFYTTYGKAAIHGSGNATRSGLMRNFEQLVFSRVWESDNSRTIVEAYETRFESFWNSQRDDSYTLSLNDKTILDIFSSTDTSVDKIFFSDLLNKLEQYMENTPRIKKLKIPTWLNYRDGDYKHQGEAVDNWINNDNRGVLEIATGGGKTLTSLVCAALSLEKAEKAVLIIAVPNKPLIKQWGLDVEHFGITPIDTEGVSSKNIRRQLNTIFRKQRAIPGHDVIIMTHAALKNKEIMSILDRYTGKLMLIGDEAHNLGASSFVDNPPPEFEHRLALSATPVRQYDEIGTEKLFNYFGDVVFQFSLKDAIGKCLVPFDYFVHQTFLNAEEQDEWNEYTVKINNLMWNKDEDAQNLIEQYLIRRRAISEGAQNKIVVFSEVLQQQRIKNYSLAFCSAKGPAQLEEVNRTLSNMGFSYHQITGDETSNKHLMKLLVETYSAGNIDILTSKKVLDEGFNIPPIQLAYFLASSGVVRTWVQRLGRVLRQSKETGKTHATVHDFIVLPFKNETSTKSLIESELKRMQWFSDHSRNGFESNGSMKLINEYLEVLENI
jgi:superfamily II DNA or RNA helicase